MRTCLNHIAATRWLVALLLVLLPLPALAGPQTVAGPYRVEISTDPAVIPVGKATLLIKITDAKGAPVEGALVRVIAQMPGMPMGEKEETATPQPGKIGVYTAPAAFSMAGGYSATVQITGPQGPATAQLSLQTGENTAAGRRPSILSFAPWLLGLLLLLFVFYRMHQSGQRIHWRAVANRQIAGGLLILALMVAVSLYLVHRYRRPGAMTPLKAQGMEMSLPAPPGAQPVQLAVVRRGTLSSTVRYSGQAVGYVEQDVIPRITGTIAWMPFYVGDKVRRGQLLARLDTSQVSPQLAQQEANKLMAQQGVAVARSDYRQAEAGVRQAESEVGMRLGALEDARSQVAKARAMLANKRGALQEARDMERRARGALQKARAEASGAERAVDEAAADLTAAREEKANAEADVASNQAQVADAQALLQSAQADRDYWVQELARMQTLVKQGAVSREEFQREQAQAADSAAKVGGAQARIEQVQAAVRGAQSRVRKADALINGARAKAARAEAALRGNRAGIDQAQSELDAATARIGQATDDIRGSQADIASAQARVEVAESELHAHHAHVSQTVAGANSARQRIAQAEAGVRQAQAGVAGAAATLSYTELRATTDGIISKRYISPGVLVSPGQAVLRVAQISPIRLQANVPTQDLARIHVGARVNLHRPDGGESIPSQVNSVAPSVDPAARTGVVETVLPNSDGSFLPGQYVVMEIATGQSENALYVPSPAIQWHTAGGAAIPDTKATPYVWVAEAGNGEADQYTVHRADIQIGISDGRNTEIINGLRAGQRVVTQGYQGLADGDTVSVPNDAESATASSGADTSQEVSITVNSQGFEPALVTLHQGVPARLRFVRDTEQTCIKEVEFPDYHIKKPLPLHQPVVVEITPRQQGEITFVCGLNMLRGKVIVQ